MKNNKTAFRQKIFLILCGLFLFVIFLEIVLRLGGFIFLSLQEYRNRIAIKQKGAYRILCLGESTTAGQYPSFLEEFLNSQNIGMKFSVIDKGIPSTNSTIILANVENYLNQYNPNLVITMMGINDVEDYMAYEESPNRFLNGYKVYKLVKFLRLHLTAKAKEIGLLKLIRDRQFIRRPPGNLPNAALKQPIVKRINSTIKEETFKNAIEIKQDKIERLKALIRYYKSQKKSIRDETSFKKVIELDSKNNKAYIELGNYYRLQRKYSDAKNIFKKAIELNPKNIDAYVGLTNCYTEQGRHSEGEIFFKKIIELDPQNHEAYYELGRLYREQNNYERSKDYFIKAIQMCPEKFEAYIELGRCHVMLDELKLAEENFKKAIELRNENFDANGGLAIVYEQMGEYQFAEKYHKKEDELRLNSYKPITANNYRKLKKILDHKGIKLVCMQYPVRSIEPLKKMFDYSGSIIFIDNGQVFKDALRKANYKEYFTDMFGGDFGHCTDKGNRLLAENIASVILKEVFNK